MSEEYSPTMDDITWALRMTGLVRPGGTLQIPLTELLYEFDHRARTIILLNPMLLYLDEHSASVHLRMIRVFGMIQWQVLVKENA